MVYRPPKHKSNPGERLPRQSTDPLSGVINRVDDPDEVLKGDDRNLVAVDESYSGGDLEDNLWLFWQRHNKKVIVLLGLACLALFGWQGWNLYQAHEVKNLQAAYDSASQSPETLLAFAQANPDSSLGKFAVLEAADSLYKSGKFKDAAEAYSKANTAWSGDEQGQRAQLGWAFSLFATGDLAGAHQHLEGIYNSSANLENFRAEAAFNNAVLYAQSGDKENATTWLDRAEGFTNSPAWATQAKTFREILPLMSDVKLVSGNYRPTPDAAKAPALSPPAPSPTPVTAAPAKAAPATATTSTTPAPANTSFDLSKLKGSP